MSPNEAVDVVARHVLVSAIDGLGIDWADYPEIGEFDWEAVTNRIDELIRFPNSDAFREAYAFLAARAERSA